MLTVPGPAHRYCDGLTRRGFLTAGTAAELSADAGLEAAYLGAA